MSVAELLSRLNNNSSVFHAFIFFQGQFLCSWICSAFKTYLSVRSHELSPRKCWKLVFLDPEWVGGFSEIHLSRAVSRSSRGQVAGKSTAIRTFSIQLGQTRSKFRSDRKKSFRATWVKYDNFNTVPDRIDFFFFSPIRWGVVLRVGFDPVWIEKVLMTVISYNWAPGESGNCSG